MKEELQAWNNGKGIDLESWVGCSGNFSLAVGYASLYCPKFVEYNGYIFKAEGITDDLISAVNGFESQQGSTKKSVEWVINHLHIRDVQHNDCEDISPDKLVVIGEALKEIYEAMLLKYFPDKPCIVEFYIPKDIEDLDDYQISFWQVKHETKSA